MHVQGKVQSLDPKHSEFLIYLLSYKHASWKTVDVFIEQSHKIFYTTQLVFLTILNESAV